MEAAGAATHAGAGDHEGLPGREHAALLAGSRNIGASETATSGAGSSNAGESNAGDSNMGVAGFEHERPRGACGGDW